MAINTNQMFTPGQNLTPEQLMQMLGLANNPNRSGSIDGKFGPEINFEANQVNRGTSVGADAEYMNDPTGAGRYLISQPRNISTMGGNDSTDVWDGTGKYLGGSSAMTDMRGLATILAMAAGGQYMYGGDAAAGAGGTAGTAGLAGEAAIDAAISNGGLNSLAAEGSAFSGLGSLSPEMLGAANSIATAGGVGSLVGGAGSAASNAKNAVDAVNGSDKAANGMSTAKTIATLAGGIAGAADGGDKTTSSTRDPWAPAQDFLKQQLAQGQQLSTQYQQNPFSQSQQTAYGNLGGLLDSINSNAGGLLGGFGANASGANNYDRNNPRRPLTGGTAMNLQGWLPGLLGNFGTTKG